MKISKRLLAVLMAVVMILTIVPLGLFVFAEGEDPTPPEPRTVTKTISISSFAELKLIGTDAEYPVASTKATAEDGAEVTTNYVYELTKDIILLSQSEKLEALLKDETEQQKAGDYYEYSPTYTKADSFADNTTYYEKQYSYAIATVSADEFDSLKSTLFVGTEPNYTPVGEMDVYDSGTAYYTRSENGYAQATGVTVDNFSEGEYYTLSYAKMTYAILQEEGKVEDYASHIGLTSDECAFTPIPSFSATFDGKGFKIVGLSISGTDKATGMFSANSGAIMNLRLENTKIAFKTSLFNADMNINAVGGIVGLNVGVIDHCSFDGTISVDAKDAVTSDTNKLQSLYSANLSIGGIIGRQLLGSQSERVTNCTSTLTVLSNFAGGTNAVAGNISGSDNNITILDNSTYARKVTSFVDYPALTESIKQEKLTEEAEKATYELLKYTAEDGTEIYYIRMIACNHANATNTPGIVATCQHVGNIEYWTCPDCGLYFDEKPTINSKSITKFSIPLLKNKAIHDKETTEKVEALDPTCGADGNIEYWYCSACKKYMIAATGAEDETVVTIEGVEGNFIEVDQSATVVKATGEHSATPFAANNPTYESDGNKAYWYCDECKQYFLEEACETPVDYDEDIVIPKLTIEVKDSSNYTEETVDSLSAIIASMPSSKDGLKLSDFIGNLKDGLEYVVRDAEGTEITDSDAIVPTNASVEIKDHPASAVKVIVRGDANGDGAVGIADYITIRKKIMETTTLDAIASIGADANGDGTVGIADYIAIKKLIMK